MNQQNIHISGGCSWFRTPLIDEPVSASELHGNYKGTHTGETL